MKLAKSVVAVAATEAAIDDSSAASAIFATE